MTDKTVQEVREWLAEKVSYRLGTAVEEVDVEKYFDEFGLESSEALVLTGELEKWLGMRIETTALWYHPTIAELAKFVVEERQKHVDNH